jgi:hypothetical protein
MAKKKALGKGAMKTTRGGYQTGGSGHSSKVTTGNKVAGTGNKFTGNKELSSTGGGGGKVRKTF